MVLVAVCVVFSFTSSRTVARTARNPLVKLLMLAAVVAMTYVSPILGGILAACFIYCVSAPGFLEGMEGEEDEKKKEDDVTEGLDGDPDDEEDDDNDD
jgi:phosphate/sulfate permease